jgi:hypothetical protein
MRWRPRGRHGHGCGMALSDTLDPFAHLLVRLASARGAVKTQLRGEAIALAVAAVAGQAAQQRARVCFFALEPIRRGCVRTASPGAPAPRPRPSPQRPRVGPARWVSPRARAGCTSPTPPRRPRRVGSMTSAATAACCWALSPPPRARSASPAALPRPTPILGVLLVVARVGGVGVASRCGASARARGRWRSGGGGLATSR